MSWKEIEGVHGELKNDRAREETLWRPLTRLLEVDGGTLDSRSDRTTQRVDTFDSTPLYAKDDFVGGLFTEAMNPADRNFEFGLEDKDLEKFEPVANWLWDYATYVGGTLDPSVSNFFLEATPTLSNMATVGTGFIAQDEDLGRQRIIERAFAISECFKSVDANGDTNRFHREYQLTGRQAKAKWRDKAPADLRDDDRLWFVHAIYENPEFRPGALGVKGQPWLSCHACKDKSDWSVKRGFFENPVHEFQWMRRSSRTWAIGPGHKALADMESNDEWARSITTALQFAAEPTILTADEDVMTAADLFPHNIVAGGMNANGKPTVQILDRGEQLNLPLAERQAVRGAIRDAFHFSLFQIANRPQMTAAEFLGWKQERLRMLAPHLVCVHRGLAGFIGRRAKILQRMDDMRGPMEKKIAPPPPELHGKVIKIRFKSPFEQAQRANQAQSAMQIGQAAIALQPLNQFIGDNLDTDHLMQKIASGLSGDPRDVRDGRMVQKIRDQRTQQTQPDVELARSAQQAGIVADVAHASQAMSSAGARGGRRA